MPAKKKPEHQFNVGDKIRVNLHHGRIEDVTIRPIIPDEKGLKLQVDFGFEQTALIESWRVVSE